MKITREQVRIIIKEELKKVLEEVLYPALSDPQRTEKLIKAAKEYEERFTKKWEKENNKVFSSIRKGDPQKKEANRIIFDNVIRFLKENHLSENEDDSDLIDALYGILEQDPEATVSQALTSVKAAGEEFAPEGSQLHKDIMADTNAVQRSENVLERFLKIYNKWYKDYFKEDSGLSIKTPIENWNIVKNDEFYDRALQSITSSEADNEEEEIFDDYKVLQQNLIDSSPKIKELKNKIQDLVKKNKEANFFTRDMFAVSKLEKMQAELQKLIEPIEEKALIMYSYLLNDYDVKKGIEREEYLAGLKAKEAERIQLMKQQYFEKKKNAYHYDMAKRVGLYRAKKRGKDKASMGDINGAILDIENNNKNYRRDKERASGVVDFDVWDEKTTNEQIKALEAEYSEFIEFQNQRKQRSLDTQRKNEQAKIEAEAAEAKRQAEEAIRAAEEAKAEEAKRKAEEAKRKAEEAIRAAEEAKRKAEEAKRNAEELAKIEMEVEEAKRIAEEAKRKAEEVKEYINEEKGKELKAAAERAITAAEEAKRQAEEAEGANKLKKAKKEAIEARNQAGKVLREAEEIIRYEIALNRANSRLKIREGDKRQENSMASIMENWRRNFI